MGLDMYLTKELFVPLVDDPELKIVLGSLKLGDVRTITFEAGYWRKQNAIHKWFVDNVQDGVDDCARHYVSKDNMIDLLNIVNKVLDDHSLAKELLPTEEGFFFGTYDYDDWYYRGLEDTKEFLEDALKPKNKDFEFYYQSSW